MTTRVAHRTAVVIGWAWAALVCASCATGPTAPAPVLPSTPTDGSARCQVAANHESPLVTEWPASEKANLEARLSEGAVLVAYSGCSMRLLSSCRVPGSYRWRRTTPATDVINIQNADDLYSKLPLGAVSLEGELQRSGQLAVQTTVSGQLELQAFQPASVPADGTCLGATHVLGSLSVGAFKLYAGGASKARGAVVVRLIGEAGGGSSRESSVLREAGDPETCRASTEAGAHPDCGSPIQVFLRALPATIRDRGAPGTIKVNFHSGEAGREWKVVSGDNEVCKTPCERFVDPAVAFALTSRAGWLQPDFRVDVPDLRARGPGPVTVRAFPRANGKFVGGIQMVTWGGLTTLAGVALIAAGCGDNSAMCTGGLVALPVGLGLTGPGLWFIVKSQPRAEVSGGAAPGAPMQLAVAGRF